MTPAGTLRAWIVANPSAPAGWLRIASKLANDHTGSLASLMAQCGGQAMPLFHDIVAAAESARKEVRRQIKTEEDAALSLVAKRIQSLREAIEHAPLPKGDGSLRTLTGEGLPDVFLRIGWREVVDVPALSAFGHPLSVVDVLGIAEQMLGEHRKRLSPRAVLRQRDRGRRAEVNSFVRWLDWSLRQRLGEHDLSRGLADVATALYAQDTDAEDVRVILKDTPLTEAQAPKQAPKKVKRPR